MLTRFLKILFYSLLVALKKFIVKIEKTGFLDDTIKTNSNSLHQNVSLFHLGENPKRTKIFPKEDNFYEGNKRLKSLINTIESYIEIEFDIISTREILDVLICMDKKSEKQHIKLDPKAQLEIDTLAKEFEIYKEPENDFNRIRNNIEEARTTLGLYTTLMLLHSGLSLNLELLFSGAILNYYKAFNASKRGRSTLEPNIVYKDHKDFLELHQEIKKLRNKHYAHADLEANKHLLTFLLSKNQKKINFELSSHINSEYWHQFDCKTFYNMTVHLQEFLKTKIELKATQAQEELSESQKEKLQQQLQKT